MNELDLLATADPAASVLAFSASESAIHELLADLGDETPRAKRSWRKRVVALSATGFALAGAGIAYAVITGQSPETTLQINCAAGVSQDEYDRTHEFTAVLGNTTGDPLADCAGADTRLTGTAPALTAYDAGGPMIYVMPSSWTPPSTWRRLDSSFRSDAARLELAQRLADLVSGPSAQCSTASAAERYAEQQLRALHLAGYRVTRLSGAAKADGTRGCAMTFLDDTGKDTILVQGIEPTTPAIPGAKEQGPTARDVAARLRNSIVNSCVTLPEAARLARQAITDAGFPASVGQIKQIIDSSRRCTDVRLLPAGDIVIVLRGPAS